MRVNEKSVYANVTAHAAELRALPRDMIRDVELHACTYHYTHAQTPLLRGHFTSVLRTLDLQPPIYCSRP